MEHTSFLAKKHFLIIKHLYYDRPMPCTFQASLFLRMISHLPILRFQIGLSLDTCHKCVLSPWSNSFVHYTYTPPTSHPTYNYQTLKQPQQILSWNVISCLSHFSFFVDNLSWSDLSYDNHNTLLDRLINITLSSFP